MLLDQTDSLEDALPPAGDGSQPQAFELRLEIAAQERSKPGTANSRGGLGSRQEQRQLRAQFESVERQLATARRAEEAAMRIDVGNGSSGQQTVHDIAVTPMPLLIR